MSSKPVRSDYVVLLEIVTLSALTHGAGTNGNESIWRTIDVLVDDVDPEIPGRTITRRLRVPVVTGASLKSKLRQHAVEHMAEVLGIPEGGMSRDALRLLLKGGKNDSSGASVSLADYRELRDLFPLLAIFGSMDGGMPVAGALQVSHVMPFARELVDAGVLRTKIGGVTVAIDGQAFNETPQIEVFPGQEPQPLHLLQTIEQYYRHDMGGHRLLATEERAALEDKAAARKGTIAKKEDRRDANESMPHAHQGIATGARMFAELRLHGATEVEWECLLHAIARWVSHGATLGGATTKGHGRCAVRFSGALSYTPAPLSGAAAPSTALSVDRLGTAYLQHLEARADAIRERVAA